MDDLAVNMLFVLEIKFGFVELRPEFEKDLFAPLTEPALTQTDGEFE
jgi:hypothetical protein